MNNINILDCTLRDGGRIINCAFSDNEIENISKGLSEAHVDLIEMGFIRNKIHYEANSTFFTEMEQIKPFIHKENGNSKYLVFVDFGMFDESKITKREKDGIDGIRFGFTRANYYEQKEEISKQVFSLKEKGYDIYLQDVNTFGYSDKELLEIIGFANQLGPVSFGIVDTYGAMDVEDLSRIFSIVNHNLHREIAIDFHSHNNMQLSFALSQEMIRLCRDSRKLIIDATLNGMGKCAGNLNLELIVSYMNRKLHSDFDIDLLLDVIDEYLYDYKQNNSWGYSIPAFMAGIYRAHPNNVIYLTEKFRLRTKDIRHIIARIDEKTRQTYDYDNIKKIYVEYSSEQIDDRNNLAQIKKQLCQKEVLILVPGNSICREEKKIRQYIKDKHPIVISVNFDGKGISVDYEFYGNIRRYERADFASGRKRIISSNIKIKDSRDIVFNYFELIGTTGKYFDNSTIMLLNLLRRLEISKITFAGFDGFSGEGNDFVDDTFHGKRFQNMYTEMNEEMINTLREFLDIAPQNMSIEFLTPSVFEKIFD